MLENALIVEVVAGDWQSWERIDEDGRMAEDVIVKRSRAPTRDEDGKENFMLEVSSMYVALLGPSSSLTSCPRLWLWLVDSQ